ncbi:CPBP family intramembrane glutamic endopeptidase [Rhizobium sp. Root149]|uniref:CPBP family intramembrane glutamic endopeptidase n=1 Tax=Rhizobium sp. Root149 TaxID=1736473 RepID=UPI0012E33443|nr:CPBP family intramembrane glutamic endopeptidase [Rhizobium sp. Root149]
MTNFDQYKRKNWLMLKYIIHSATKIFRIIFIDCAVPILFLLATGVIATTLSTFMAIILSGEKLEGIVKIRASHLTAVVTGNGPLLLASLIRLQPIRQSFRSPRSIMAAIAIGILLLAINVLAQIGKVDVGLEFSLSAGLMILSTCVFTPVVEELFFRGYLWARLQARGYGEVSIIICTALLFAAIHLPDNFASLFNYLRMGFSFSLIRYFSGGIGLPIFFHAAMNFIVIRHIGV